MAKKTTSKKEKTIEQMLWDSANVLRGNLDAAEYKSVVLGLVFLKYINDCFMAKYNELVAEGAGFEEDSDEYIGDNIFFVPSEARWSKIAESAHYPAIGAAIDAAMEALEKDNKQLQGILPKNYARPELDKRRLGDVVEIFNNLSFDRKEARDVLGRVYEYFLGEFAREEGKRGGEFYTPSCIVRTIVEVIEPYKGKIYDPACGSGGMFVQSAKFIERHAGNIQNISVYGQELNSNTWRLAQMNLAIRGIEANFGGTYADSFHDDRHPFLKADFVMANPKFNDTEWGGELLLDDPRWKYGIPPTSNANYAWIQHMLYHLSDNGRIGLVLASSSLSSKPELSIRKNIIEADLVEGIIDMPPQLFYNVKIPCCLWILSKRKEQKGKILFIDARKLGHMVDRTHRELSSGEYGNGNDIEKISDAFSKFRDGVYVPEDNFSAVASIEEVFSNNCTLSPRVYVGRNTFEFNSINKTSHFNDSLKLLINSFDKLRRLRGHDSFPFESRALYSLISTNINKIIDSLFYLYFVELAPFKDRENQESFLASIPNDWAIFSFDEFITPSTEKCGNAYAPEYSVTNRGIFPRSENYAKQLSKDSSKNKLIRKGDLIFGMSREILNWGIMEDNVGSVSPAYKVFRVNSEKISYTYLKLFINNNLSYFSDLIKPAAREGQSIDEELLYGKQIYIPTTNDWNLFTSCLNGIIECAEVGNILELNRLIGSFLSSEQLLPEDYNG